MIKPETILEVERLLAAGTLSMTKIAAQTRISRSLVSNIAHGKRKLKPRSLFPREAKNFVLDERGIPFRLPTGPVARCPECGANVRFPCLACQIARKIRVSERISERYDRHCFDGKDRFHGI